MLPEQWWVVRSCLRAHEDGHPLCAPPATATRSRRPELSASVIGSARRKRRKVSKSLRFSPPSSGTSRAPSGRAAHRSLHMCAVPSSRCTVTPEWAPALGCGVDVTTRASFMRDQRPCCTNTREGCRRDGATQQCPRTFEPRHAGPKEPFSRRMEPFTRRRRLHARRMPQHTTCETGSSHGAVRTPEHCTRLVPSRTGPSSSSSSPTSSPSHPIA